MLEIILENTAFADILWTSLNNYQMNDDEPKEFYATLIGYKLKKNKYLIRGILVWDEIIKTSDMIEFPRGKENMINKFLEYFPSENNIGEIHSHPDGLASMSKTDKESCYDDEIQIIVAINKYKKAIRWKNIHNGNLKGTLAGYIYELAGWVKLNGRIMKGKVICPASLQLEHRIKEKKKNGR